MPPASQHVLGVILAGGLSRRMGGGDKALSRLGETSLLERIVQRLWPQVGALVLNANGDGTRFMGFGLPLLPDTVSGFPGPLAGILAGLDYAANRGFSHVMAVPCDAPFLPPDLVERLGAAAGEGGAVASSGGRRHPAVALWPVRLAAQLRSALVEEDVRRVELVLRRYGFAPVEWRAEPFDPFLNINDRAGLAEAAVLASQWPSA